MLFLRPWFCPHTTHGIDACINAYIRNALFDSIFQRFDCILYNKTKFIYNIDLISIENDRKQC